MKKQIFGLSFMVMGLILCQNHTSCATPPKVNGKSYLQERMVRVQIPLEGPQKIVKLIKMGEEIAAISPDHLFLCGKGKWRVENLPGEWQTACADPSGKLWLAAIGRIYGVAGKNELQLPAEAAKDTIHTLVWTDAKTLLAGTNRGAWQWNGSWSRLPEFKSLKIHQIIQGKGEELWAATGGGLFRKIGGKWVNLSYAVMSPGLGLNYLSLSTGTTADEIYFGCQPAVGLIAGSGDHQLYSADNGLPYGPVTTIVKEGSDLWLGTAFGAIRKSGDVWRYYAGKRWLDHNQVNDILPLDSRRVWVATAEGINQIEKMPLTLEQKAAYFEKRLNERHLHYGFASECRFKSPNDTTSFTHSTNDNDGLWTSIYLAAESFRYSVTGEKDAYDNAVRTFLAMEKLNTVNPIPGYVARSYVSIEESTGEGGE